jgi:rubrerythrin
VEIVGITPIITSESKKSNFAVLNKTFISAITNKACLTTRFPTGVNRTFLLSLSTRRTPKSLSSFDIPALNVEALTKQLLAALEKWFVFFNAIKYCRFFSEGVIFIFVFYGHYIQFYSIYFYINHWYDDDSLNQSETIMSLSGSKTEQSLKDAFAGESQANRRYLYFANQCDVLGEPDMAALFRSTAEGETGHAHGHMEHLIEGGVGDPGTDMPAKEVSEMLASAIHGETHEYTDMYPGMAKTAREEGFDEIAEWFETLAKAERSHANRYQKAFDSL